MSELGKLHFLFCLSPVLPPTQINCGVGDCMYAREMTNYFRFQISIIISCQKEAAACRFVAKACASISWQISLIEKGKEVRNISATEVSQI